jgi:hypothetical protein
LFPSYREPELAGKLDELCVAHKVGVLGTGVNPGFVMETLPVLLTAVSQSVETVRVLRVVDAGTRREALQRKVGAGLEEAEFHELARDLKIRHVGLTESLVFIADALGWNLDAVEESIAPVIADKAVTTRYLTVKQGSVAGVRQIAHGRQDDREVLTLELQMYVGAPNPRDEITIQGTPPLHVEVQGGTPGDFATPAILVNSLPQLMAARPGLHTMKTVSLPHA